MDRTPSPKVAHAVAEPCREDQKHDDADEEHLDETLHDSYRDEDHNRRDDETGDAKTHAHSEIPSRSRFGSPYSRPSAGASNIRRQSRPFEALAGEYGELRDRLPDLVVDRPR